VSKKKPSKPKAPTLDQMIQKLIDTYTAGIDRLEENAIHADARVDVLEKRIAELEGLFGIGDEDDDPIPPPPRTWLQWLQGE